MIYELRVKIFVKPT